MSKTIFFPLAVAAVLLAGCKGTIDRRVDPDQPDAVGGAALQSQDIRTMARRMADSIRAAGVLQRRPEEERITFHITEMKNESSDTINRSIILAALETELMKALQYRVRVLDRSAEGLEAVRAEREAKRASAVTANVAQRGEVLGSDYILKGVIRDRVQQSGRMKSAYYLVTFQLTDLETSEKVWQDDYETKFESEKSVITR
jgi:uncharacterized protein (TIGR02722 family)